MTITLKKYYNCHFYLNLDKLLWLVFFFNFKPDEVVLMLSQYGIRKWTNFILTNFFILNFCLKISFSL